MNRPEYLSGYLYYTDRAVSRESLLLASSIKFKSALISRLGWEEYEFSSPVRLLDEDDWQNGPFLYRLICKRSGNQILVLAKGKRVVEYLGENDLRRIFRPNLKRVSIKIDELVRLIAKSPDKYVLSSIYARVPAFGKSLRAVSFFGDDIAEADLFRDNIGLLNCYTCGVRDVVGGAEIVRLGTEGYVFFYFSGKDSLQRVDEVLSYVIENDFMYEER